MNCFYKLLVLLLVVSAQLCMAQNTAKLAQYNGTTRAYLEYLPPDYTANGDKVPAIIFLHGHGERGNINNTNTVMNIANVNYNTPPSLVQNGNDMCFDVDGETICFAVFSPQESDNYHSWVDKNQNRNSVQPFVQFVLDNYNVDPDRIYLTGFSMGAAGAYEAALSTDNEPNLYAAVAPVAGKAFYSDVCRIPDAGISVWAFHGENDNTENSFYWGKRTIDKLLACEGDLDVVWTPYPGVDHVGACTRAYRGDHSLHNPNLYEWFGTKVRGEVDSVYTPLAPDQLAITNVSYAQVALSWSDNSDNESGFQIERSVGNNSSYSLLTSTASGVESYVDTNVAPETTYFYRIRSYNTAGNSAYSTEVSVTTDAVNANSTITWTDVVGLTVELNNDLSKGSEYQTSAGAASEEVLGAGDDGWFQIEVGETGYGRWIGLSEVNTDPTGGSIDYCIYISNYEPKIFIYEDGVSKGYKGVYAEGDIFRVERIADTIYYKQNGNLLYKSLTPSSTDLLVDVHIAHKFGKIHNPAISFGNGGGSPAQTVIIDNNDPGVTTSGVWTASTAGSTDRYGADYFHDGNAGKGTKSISYSASLTPGTYEVYGWWFAFTNRATNVPFDIVHGSGTSTVYMNQQNNNAQWVSLGVYTFNSTGEVIIRNDNTSGYVVADAIKFVPQAGSTSRLANGLSPKDSENQAVLYPNPVNSKLNLSLGQHIEGAVNIKIMDLTGRIEWQNDYNGSNKLELDLSEMKISNGVKIISVTHEGEEILVSRLKIER
ncbi:golvesin C-terminal-like domain-containing protein [Fulvivirga ligni]|uniref:golvesin C-terminal-like domain-containing protein n=1 Tax=Fulvivirga ligni TaxID=2904246 RepID=UPI001EE9F740|nr:T9SS type A sorting domain-containing protein [Fulvivirga ligni]UII23982.1 hypothetical protein LVD16_12210 [Fulvivirga ligni]